MDWLPMLLALLLLGGLLCRADEDEKNSTIPATEPEDPETSSTVPITSLRMYHLDPPVKRRSFENDSQTRNATAEEEPSNRTIQVVQPRSGKLPVPASHCYLNETKADDEEILGWLDALPADRKLRLLKTLGYDPVNCVRPRRRCSKKTPPEMRKFTKAAEVPPATTTTSTSTTTPAAATTTLTPETEVQLTTTTEFVPSRRMLTPTTTPDPTLTPGTTTTTTTTTVAPPPKKEKSKCRKKKKTAAKKLKEAKE
ncbi:hypothetical protein TSAR_012759 [Trichomalopsis sarcophagae]|uniref:Uncharacterized protein n=1 Tax=Trichomalopsis sarcophagae TaxID=543379 RepID=A0A232F0C3_9HYME|nr:hypothetical protein TSAR_012759 [Trichomalopsis sarcophagae]